MDGKTQQSTAVNKGSYTSGIRSKGGTGPVKRFNNPKDAYNDSYNDVYAKLNGKSSWVTPDTTVDQYIHRYAPKEDNNNPASYAQHAIGYFNKLLGNNSINLNSELGDIKDLLISKGFDPEHEFTRMHLRMEDPSVLADLGKTVTTKPESKTPQVTTPKTQSQVNINPTFTASPFTAPKVTESKPQPQQPVDSRFRVVPEVLPKIEQPKTNKPSTRQDVSSVIEEKLKIKPTEEQLNVIMNPNLSWYQKGRELGIIPETKSFSGPQSISQPNRLQEAWETLNKEGLGALISQITSASTSPNEGLEQKIKPIPEPNVNNEKSQIVKENKIKPKEEEPSRVALGSKIENYGGDPDRYIEPFKINTNSAKFGVRSRGEEQDIKTEGAVFTTFKPWTYASSPEYVNEFNYYLVVDKANGTLKISTNPKQNKDSLLNDQTIKGNPEMVTTGTYGRLAKSLNLNGNYNDGISTKTLGYVNQNNKQASLPTFGIGKDGTELGGYKGGKLILSKPDGSDPVIVYGSAQIVINEFNKYKEKHKLDNVLVLDADGKSYAQSYQTKSKVLKGSNLRSKNWDNANSASAGSGNILYLK